MISLYYRAAEWYHRQDDDSKHRLGMLGIILLILLIIICFFAIPSGSCDPSGIFDCGAVS